MIKFYFVYLFSKISFIYFREESARESTGAGKSKGGERISSRLHAEPDSGLDLTTRRSWPEPKQESDT